MFLRSLAFHNNLGNADLVNQILYNNQINARALIGQSAVGYRAGKPTENRASSELLCKSNRPQVSMGYRLINHLGRW